MPFSFNAFSCGIIDGSPPMVSVSMHRLAETAPGSQQKKLQPEVVSISPAIRPFSKNGLFFINGFTKTIMFFAAKQEIT